MTSNSVCSSAAGPAAAAAGAAATAAAAETPHFSSSIFDRSAASRTVSAERSSTIFARSAMFILHQNRDSPGNKFQFSSKSRCFFGGICAKNPRQLARRGCGDLRNLGGRSLHQTNDLGAQLVERRKRSQRLYAIHVEDHVAHAATNDFKLVVGLGKFHGDLRSRDRIGRGCKGRGAGQQFADTGVGRAIERNFGKTVLREAKVGSCVAHLLWQHRRLGDGHANVSDYHTRGS